MLYSGSSTSQSDASTGEKKPASMNASTSTRDPDRFYCPYEGCNRSFAELWRLKVHYRAAPDVRGSGKERGHGAELESCPKCGAELKPGRHHVGCAAGKHAVAQQERRRRLKGRKRSGCKGSNSTSAKTVQSSQVEEPSASRTTAVGVPISWMPLDFNQFLRPIQRTMPELESKELLPDIDNVHSWVYGNQGELPTMAMAQVGLDSEFAMDFSKFLCQTDDFDPVSGLGLQTIKEELPMKNYASHSDHLFEDFSLYEEDGLDKFLTGLHEAEEKEDEDLSDLTGKKRERRSSLERRLEKRNGSEPNRKRSDLTMTTSPMQRFPPTHPPTGPTPTTIHEPFSQLLGEATMHDPLTAQHLSAPYDFRLDDRGIHSALLPTVERNELGMLVQRMSDFELQKTEEQMNGIDSMGEISLSNSTESVRHQRRLR